MKKIKGTGLVDRSISFPIKVNGHTLTASPGDTLASAITANCENSKLSVTFDRHALGLPMGFSSKQRFFQNTI